jgi:hypothetical protein
MRVIFQKSEPKEEKPSQTGKTKATQNSRRLLVSSPDCTHRVQEACRIAHAPQKQQKCPHEPAAVPEIRRNNADERRGRAERRAGVKGKKKKKKKKKKRRAKKKKNQPRFDEKKKKMKKAEPVAP